MIIIIYYVIEIVPSLASGKSFRLGCILLTCLSFFFLFEYFLIFWRNKILQTHLVLFQLQPWNQPCLQGALVLFGGWWYLDTKIWVRVVLRGLTASGPGF